MNKARALEFLTKKFKIKVSAENKYIITFGFEVVCRASRKEFEHDPAGQMRHHLNNLEVEFNAAMRESRRFVAQSEGYKKIEDVPEVPEIGWGGSCRNSVWLKKELFNVEDK